MAGVFWTCRVRQEEFWIATGWFWDKRGVNSKKGYVDNSLPDGIQTLIGCSAFRSVIKCEIDTNEVIRDCSGFDDQN